MITFNNFYRFITGLANGRFVYQEAPKKPLNRMKEDVPSTQEMDKELEKYAKGETVAAAGETDEKYLKRMEEMKKADQKKLAELVEKNTRKANAKPVEPTTVETPFGDISVYRKGYPKFKSEKARGVPPVKPEVALQGAPAAPKPTADEVKEKEEARKRTEQELARLTPESQKGPWRKEATPGENLQAKSEVAINTAENNQDIFKLALQDIKNSFESKGYELNEFAKNLSKVSAEISAYLATTPDANINDGELEDKLIKNREGQAKYDALVILDMAKGLEIGRNAPATQISQVIYGSLVEGGALTGPRKTYFDKIARHWLPDLAIEA